LNERPAPDLLSDFLRYLATHANENGGRIPPLAEISRELGVSVASLREQLEVARALGLVEVRPRTGIRRLPYTFQPAVRQSLAYAIAIDPRAFNAFSDLRNHIETAYWYEAVGRLNSEDHDILRGLIVSAKEKLASSPPQIPHKEHRDLHLTIYRRLNNPFVQGLLETYWELYEAVGLNIYTDFTYLQQVWRYHERMVEAICSRDYAAGYQALSEHNELLYRRSKPAVGQNFE
jgi:DNA-binding FadR family transcriptional regulator